MIENEREYSEKLYGYKTSTVNAKYNEFAFSCLLL